MEPVSGSTTAAHDVEDAEAEAEGGGGGREEVTTRRGGCWAMMLILVHVLITHVNVAP